MANLQIKNVPDDVHAELRRRADLRGISLRDYVLQLIRLDQRLPTMQEWLDEVRQNRPIELDRPAHELIAEDRAERDRELARRSSRPDTE